jgi:hypothetical protein
VFLGCNLSVYVNVSYSMLRTFSCVQASNL